MSTLEPNTKRTLIKNIFGRAVKFQFESEELFRVVESELHLYQDAPAGSVDLIVDDNLSFEGLRGRNPAHHTEMDDGFIAKFGAATIRYRFTDGRLVRASLVPQKHSSRFRESISRMKSRQYATSIEAIGQTIHEQILVPSTFFETDRVPIHAAGVYQPDGTAILLGGTGGVGKTSMELALTRKNNFYFLADDFSILDHEGTAYPNYAFPKIYAYNVSGDSLLRDEVLKQRNVFDKLHWRARSKLLGDSSVRRRMNPQELYGITPGLPVSVGSYVILLRSPVEDFRVTPISTEQAVEATMSILKTEYMHFWSHLYWSEFAQALANQVPIISLESIMTRVAISLSESLNSVSTQCIEIPASKKHTEIMEALPLLILNTLR